MSNGSLQGSILYGENCTGTAANHRCLYLSCSQTSKFCIFIEDFKIAGAEGATLASEARHRPSIFST
jgi:hypothetical protein